MPDYNPFSKHDKIMRDTENQLVNYQTRYDVQGIPIEDPPSLREKFVEGAKKVGGATLQGLDILFRPFNAVFMGTRETVTPGSTDSKNPFDAVRRGWKGEEYAGLGDVIADRVPMTRIPVREYGTMLKAGAKAATPEEVARLKHYIRTRDYGQPEEPGFWNAVKHAVKEATIADVLGLYADTKAIGAMVPRLAPVVKQYQGAKKGTGSTYQVSRLPGQEAKLKNVLDEIAPEVDTARRAMEPSMIEKLRGMPKVSAPTGTISNTIPGATDVERRVGAFLRDIPDIDPKFVVPASMRNAIDKIDSSNYAIASYGAKDGSQAIRTIGVSNKDAQAMANSGATVRWNPDGTTTIVVPTKGIDDAQAAAQWDNVLKHLSPVDDVMPLEPSSVSKRVSAFDKKYGATTEFPEDVAGGINWGRTSPGRTLHMKQDKVIRPELYDVAQDAAKALGVNLDELVSQVGRAPKLDDVKGIANESHWRMVAGLKDRPRELGRGSVQMEHKAKKIGHEIKFGPLTIAGQKPTTEAVDAFKKAVYEKIPGTSHVAQMMGPMFSRRFLKKGSPERVAKVADILDDSAAVGRTDVQELIKKIGPVFSGMSGDELRLITYARDTNKLFDFSDAMAVANIIKGAELNLDVNKIVANASKYQNVLNESGKVFDEFADVEMGLKILDETRENYVPHIYEMTPKFAELYSAKNTAARRFAQTHKFSKRTGPETLIAAKELNREAAKAGLPPPYKIKEDRINRLMGIRASAHHSTKSNVMALNEIKGLGHTVIDTKYRDGFIKPEIPQLSKYWVHPELNRLIVEATGKYTATGPAFQKFLMAMQRIHLPWKALVTRVVPSFHIRNEMDNLMKLYLTKTSMKYLATAANIMRGADGNFVTKAGETSYGEIRRMLDTKGLRGTGIYGHFGDIPSDIAKVAMDTAEGPLRHFAKWVNPLELGRRVGDTLETHTKLTKFLHEFVKYGDPDYAAKEANRIMFNYADLTPVERDVMRTVYPFWTFHRKNIPLMHEMLLNNPDQFLKLQAVKGAIERKFPQENPEEEHVPEWLEKMWNVRMPGEGQRPGTTQYFTPGFSLNSLFMPYMLPEESLKNLAPLFKMMVEMPMDQSAFTGRDISGHGERNVQLPGYFDQLPEPLKKEFGIYQATHPETNEPMTVGPAKLGYMFDGLTGSSIREIGNIFKTFGSGDDQRNMLGKAFVKEIDHNKVKYYKMREELDRMRARTTKFRNEGKEVFTMEEMGIKRNPFAKARLPQ